MSFRWRVLLELALRALVLAIAAGVFLVFGYWTVHVLWIGAWFEQWWVVVAFALAILAAVLWFLAVGWAWKGCGRLLDRLDKHLWLREDNKSRF